MVGGNVSYTYESDLPTLPQSYGEWFDEQFPYYLEYGMSYSEYWELSPYLARAYRDKHRLETEKQNEMMWWQGYYNFIAYSTALSNLNFSGKHQKPNKYLEKPIRITPLTEKEEQAEKKKAENSVVSFLDAFAQSFNAERNGDG